MNVLINQFPTKIQIEDKIYEINTDFRNCINIMLAFEDKELADEEKYEIMLELLYKDKPEENIEIAIQKAILFLDCGEIEEKNGENYNNIKRLYSFTKDAKYIYSAIKQSYGIELDKIDYMHWWKFVYLFLGLDKDTFFSQIIYLRKKKQEGKLTKEERQTYIKMFDILELEQDKNYTEEEQNEINEFNRLLKEGEQNEDK